jgi:hypothetical protein
MGVDNILIPDGNLLANEKYSVNDFWSSPKQIGANQTAPELLGNWLRHLLHCQPRCGRTARLAQLWTRCYAI